MKHIYRIMSVLAAAAVSVACIDRGGYVFGELPPGATPVEGEALEARNAVYNESLNELTVNWRSTADPSIYKGVELSYTMLSGATKTVRMYANKNFPSSYDKFSVLTVNPETVRYRCLWIDEEGNESTSEWASVDDLQIKRTTSNDIFAAYLPPKFKLVTDAGVSDQAASAYAGIVGKDTRSQEAYYTDLLIQVLSSMYYSTTDSGERPLSWLKCILGPMDLAGALAYVSGDSEGPLMKLDSGYLESIAKGNVNHDDAVFEIRGVLIHEFTHLVQKTVPYNNGDNMNYSACIEGFADAVRCACGGVTDYNRRYVALNAGAYHDPNRTENGKYGPYVWQVPYGVSGYFMSWLRYYDGDFLRKLSQTMVSMKGDWSLENAVKYILGADADIQKLWEEYIEDVKAENAQ